jgi:hypothetical protein
MSYIRRCRERRSRAITSNFRRSFSNTGFRRRKFCRNSRFIIKPENRFRRRWLIKSKKLQPSIKASARSNISPARCRYETASGGSQKIDADKFERETLAQLGMPREIVMRHRTPQFGHVFSSDGYSAGYYSYLWSDVLTADAFGAFTEGKGAYDKSRRAFD